MISCFPNKLYSIIYFVLVFRVTPYLNQRFVKGFNASSVQLISLRGNHFVLVNSMALEGDGCDLCRSAEQELVKIESL